MISLKRNSKGEFVKATGLRKTARSMYVPDQKEIFKISRSKFTDFLSCRRCFYLDRVGGIVYPSIPRWTLNETTDILLKKEFDECRINGVPHRIFGEYGLDGVLPYEHPDIDDWRDSLHHGLEYRVAGTNIILHGGVDDVWQDVNSGELIIVDYKSQSNSRPITTEGYLAYVYHQSYKIQLDFYAYLLIGMGHEVSRTCYFYVCNAVRSAKGFYGVMGFEETLVPYDWDVGWIEPRIMEMIAVLNSKDVPMPNESCENCAYARERALAEGMTLETDNV